MGQSKKNWFSDLLPAIQNLSPKILGLNSFTPNMELPEDASIGGLAQNAVSDVENIGGAVANIPNDINTAFKDPSTILPAIGNYAKGTIKQYGNIINKPAESFYNNPVNTALAVLPVIKGIKGIGETAPKAAIEENAATTVGNRFLRGQYKASPKVMDNFTPEHLNQLADWGITTPKQVTQAHDMFTGGEGVATQIIRNAVAKAKPVDPTGLDAVAKNIMQETYGVSPADEAKFINNTAKEFAVKIPNKTTININGQDIATKDPLETYDFMQSIKAKAAELSKSSNEANRNMGKAYRSFAQELDDRLFVNSGANDILNNSQMQPDFLEKINAISPKLAQQTQDVMQNGTIGDLKHLQQPLVTANRAAEETAGLAKGSPMSLRNVLALYIGIHNPAVAATILASNTGIGENILGKTFRGAGDIISKANDKNIPAKASFALGTLPNIGEVPQNQVSNENQKKNQNVLPPVGSVAPSSSKVNSIPQSQDQITFDEKGHVGVYNPYNGTDAVTKAQYQSQLAQYQQQIKQFTQQKASDWGNPSAQAQDQANIDNVTSNLETLTALNNKSRSLDAPYQSALNISSMGNKATDDIKNGWSSIALANGSLDKLATIKNGAYSKLASALKKLQDESGIQIFIPGMDLNVALGNLQQAVATTMYNTYYSQFPSQGGFNQLPEITGAKNTTIQNPNQLPPITSPAQSGQNSGYGTPHPFVY